MKPGQITLSTSAPRLTIIGYLGDSAPTVTGYGGWSEVARPKRIALTQWQGRSPFRLSFSIVLDGFETNDSVERHCSSLERMALPPSPGSQPPIVKVAGPVPHTDLTWVVESLTWDEAIWSNKGRYRLRQNASLTLLRYVPEDRIDDVSASERMRRSATQTGKSSTHGRVYVVKSGDTLSGIAAKELGSYKRWSEIAKKNSIRDPNTIRVGQTLRLP